MLEAQRPSSGRWGSDFHGISEVLLKQQTYAPLRREPEKRLLTDTSSNVCNSGSLVSESMLRQAVCNDKCMPATSVQAASSKASSSHIGLRLTHSSCRYQAGGPLRYTQPGVLSAMDCKSSDTACRCRSVGKCDENAWNRQPLEGFPKSSSGSTEKLCNLRLPPPSYNIPHFLLLLTCFSHAVQVEMVHVNCNIAACLD